jgi:hypothetical protein
MRFVILALLLVAVHFNATPFAPAPTGKGSFYGPFAADSKPWLNFIGGFPRQPDSAVRSLLAGLRGA